MSETKRYMPFWREFLYYLLIALDILAYVIFNLTKELLFFILFLAIFVAAITGLFWGGIEEYRSRLERRGFLGVFLLFISGFLPLFSSIVTEWIWVELCIALLGSALMLYDIASKRNPSNAELEE